VISVPFGFAGSSASLSLLEGDRAVANDGTVETLRREEPRWPIEFQQEDFIFHCDFDVRQRGDIVRDLVQLRTDIAQELKIRIAAEPIHLLLFGSAANYRGYMRTYFPDVPERRALFIKRRGPGMVFAYDSRSLGTDLRHETTHALLNASLAYVPLWLDEGMAEYFEVPASKRQTEGEHMRMVRWRATLGHVPNTEELDSIRDLAAMGAAQYRDAWSWVHFLLHFSPSSRQCLQRYLQDVQAGLPPGPFPRRLAADLPDAKLSYLQHFRRW
jgi:hypothetical protein